MLSDVDGDALPDLEVRLLGSHALVATVAGRAIRAIMTFMSHRLREGCAHAAEGGAKPRARKEEGRGGARPSPVFRRGGCAVATESR